MVAIIHIMIIFKEKKGRANDEILCFVDIDGTLLDNSTNRIPDSALEAINLAKENGHKVLSVQEEVYLQLLKIF